MRKKWFLIGGATVVILAAALYGGLVIYPEAEFRGAMREAQQFLPPGTSLDYKTADYSLFTDRGTLTGVTLRTAGSLGLAVTSEMVVLERPSVTLGNDLQRAEANPAGLAPDGAIPVADAVTFTNLTIRSLGGSEKIASARISGPRLYPWALLHPGVPTWAEAMAPLTAKPPPKSLSAFLPLLRFEAAIMLGVGYTAIDASDIAVTAEIPVKEGRPTRAITYRVARSRGSSNDRGIFGPGEADHIALDLGPPAGTVTIDRVAVDGFHLREPFTDLLTATRLTPALLNGLVIGRFEMAGMIVKPPSRPPVTLGTFTLSRIAVANGLPVSAALAWHGLRLTPAEMPNPKARAAFRRLGLDAMTIDFDLSYNWEVRAERLALQELRLQIAELGSLDLSASLVGATPGPEALFGTRLAHAVLHYKDASLVERAFNAAAATMHTNPHALREQMIAIAGKRADEFADNPAIVQASQAIIAFLNDPHSLTIALSPQSPVALATLRTSTNMTLPDLASLLGVHVTANH